MEKRIFLLRIGIILILILFVFSSFGQIDITGQIDSLIRLSEKYKYSDLMKSKEYAEEALKLSRRKNDQIIIASCLSNLAGIYYSQADYAKSLQLYEECLQKFEELNNQEGIAKITNNIGVIHLAVGSLSVAFINFQSALDQYQKLSNLEGESSCLNNLGLIYQEQEDYKKSLDYFYQALELKIKLNNKYSIKQTLFNIGTSYYYLSEFDSSEYYLNKCLLIERQINDLYGISISLNSLGMIELVKGRPDNALDLFMESLRIGQSLGDKEALIYNWNNIGIVFLVSNNYNKAVEYFDSSLDLAIELNLTNKIQDIYKNFSSVLEKQEKFKEAFESYRLYTMLANQFINEQKRTINIENEYKLLEVEKEKQKQRIYLVILLAVIIILIVIAIFIIKQRQLKHKSVIEHTLAEQEKIRFKSVIEASEQERKRIAGDLHDSINSMLSTAKLNMTGLEDDLQKHSDIDKKLLNNSINLIDEAFNEVRNISHNLMPGSLTKLGLFPALKDLVRKINQSHKLDIKLDYPELDNRLEETVEIALFRIVQESINNTIKHAGANEAEIKIEKNNNFLFVVIKDNGKGFNPDILEHDAGIGWKNIYSRIGMINGKIEIDSKPGKGTIIKLSIPL